MANILNGNGNKTSDRIHFRAREIFRDKERHYIMIRGSILQEDITILNGYQLTAEI